MACQHLMKRPTLTFGMFRAYEKHVMHFIVPAGSSSNYGVIVAVSDRPGKRASVKEVA